MGQPYIAVDLDGTLAFYENWKGWENIGEPIIPMLNIIKQWLTEGIKIKIFTARACYPEAIPFIKQWLNKQGLPDLEITNKKDFDMVTLYDDRCKQVITNTGIVIESTKIDNIKYKEIEDIRHKEIKGIIIKVSAFLKYLLDRRFLDNIVDDTSVLKCESCIKDLSDVYNIILDLKRLRNKTN